jgi:hypothetical protein
VRIGDTGNEEFSEAKESCTASLDVTARDTNLLSWRQRNGVALAGLVRV